MKLPFALPLITAAILVLSPSVSASTPEMDSLLSSIKADIAAQRLSSPEGNNALERIETFRTKAPFDFRVVPLVYAWGDEYLKLANKAIDAKEYAKAQAHLDRVWQMAALTQGLEEVQTKLDKLYKAPATNRAIAAPSTADVERQQRLAEAAEREKARVEAERKRKEEQERIAAAAERKRAEDERLRRQAEERQRRAEAEALAKAQQQAATPTVAAVPAAAPKAAVAPVVQPRVAAVVIPTTPIAAPAAVARPVARTNATISNMWSEAEETSAPIASYPLPAEQLDARDRNIVQSLEPICKAIMDNEASVVVHTNDKADYRWLTVRLTLCVRDLNSDFRLRHSHNELASGSPHITLHPAREVSLVRQTSS